MGASMVKWTKIVLRCTKTIGFFGQRPKSSAKVSFKLDFYFLFLHDDLYCCVKYSNVEYQS